MGRASRLRRAEREATARQAPPRRVPISERHIVIGILSGRVTYPEFVQKLLCIRAPSAAGISLDWKTGGAGSIAILRNLIAREALKRFGAQPFAIWWLDDDHTFEPDVLVRLARRDVDLVVPMVMPRTPPLDWLAWDVLGEDVTDASDEHLARVGKAARRLSAVPARVSGGLVELGFCGTGGLLMSSEVLHAMADPWFEWGRVGADEPGEDTWFCLKAARLGFHVFCDVETHIGHLATAAVWPKMAEGGRVAFEFLPPNSTPAATAAQAD